MRVNRVNASDWYSRLKKGRRKRTIPHPSPFNIYKILISNFFTGEKFVSLLSLIKIFTGKRFRCKWNFNGGNRIIYPKVRWNSMKTGEFCETFITCLPARILKFQIKTGSVFNFFFFFSPRFDPISTNFHPPISSRYHGFTDFVYKGGKLHFFFSSAK